MLIKKAIFPVAGFGTRLLPATKAQPKEMLPVVDKPAIQYLVEDAKRAGIKEIIFVTGRGKTAIENHFDHSFELEHTLVEKGKHDLLKAVCEISELAKFSYVRQPRPLGDGHALNCAAHLIFNEPVLVMFGDTLYNAEISPAQQVISAFEKYGGPVIGLSEVAREDVSKFGIADGVEIDSETLEIKGLVEKPPVEEALSCLAAVGAYVITPEVFEVLRGMDFGKSGEIRLTDAFDIMLEKGHKIYGRKLEGEWLDTGDKFGLLKASITLGMKDSEMGDRLKQYIKSLNL